MQYEIICVYQGQKEPCVQVIDVPNDNAAVVHYEGICVRQPDHPDCKDYTAWALVRLSTADGVVIVAGETPTEKEVRLFKELLSRKGGD